MGFEVKVKVIKGMDATLVERALWDWFSENKGIILENVICTPLPARSWGSALVYTILYFDEIND